MEKILVTGATGTIGKALVKALQEKNTNFVAGVRNAKAAKEILPGASLVGFDFADSGTFERATEGVDRVFLLGPPLVTNLDELLTPFIDFLQSKQILRVLYVASLGCEKLAGLPFHTVISEKLANDGFEYTIIKPSFFAQNFKNYEWDNIMQRGVTYTPAGLGQVGFIDVNDIGKTAAEILTSAGHVHQTYELTGPELLSYADAAALLSEVTGKPVVYPNPDPEEYTAALKAAGAPDFIAPYMISVYSLIADHEVALLTDTVERITGKKPGSLKAVLERDFLGSGL